MVQTRLSLPKLGMAMSEDSDQFDSSEELPPEEDEQSSDPRATDHMVFIVVGAHLRAEMADRPLGYELLEKVNQWAEDHDELLAEPIEPVVVSDLWYLNDETLQKRPTISVGGPGVNALSAFFAQQLPESASDGEQQVIIQIDPDFTDLRVCIWGTDHALTAQGVELFSRQYLDSFLRAAATQVEPHED